MFKKGLFVVALTLMTVVGVAQADGIRVSVGDGDIGRLEQMVRNLSERVRNLEIRVSHLDQQPIPAPAVVWSCSLVDNFNTSYIGHGPTQIDATFDARNQCQAKVNAMFCQNAPTCESSQ